MTGTYSAPARPSVCLRVLTVVRVHVRVCARVCACVRVRATCCVGVCCVVCVCVCVQTCFSLTAGVFTMFWELFFESSQLDGFLGFCALSIAAAEVCLHESSLAKPFNS